MGMASSRYNLGCALVSGAGKASPQQNVKAQGAGVNHPRYKLGPLSTVASKFFKRGNCNIGPLPEYFITFHLHYITFALHYICI